MTVSLCFFVVAIFIIEMCNTQPHSMNGTIYYNTHSNTYNITVGIMDCDVGLCCGYFQDTLNSTGWSILELKTNINKTNTINDTHRMYSCGYLEGYLTSYSINTYFDLIIHNEKALLAAWTKEFKEWYNIQTEWINQQISQNKNDSYWIYIHSLQSQFNGLHDGYITAANKFNLKHKLTLFDFSFINAWPDYVDVGMIMVVNNGTIHMDKTSFMKQYGAHTRLHCSGLVKVTPTLDNIYFAHDTWTLYWTMNRIYKHYIFHLNDQKYATKHMSFSSYPGLLWSMDDYYQMDNGMAVMETTNSQLNPQLCKLCNPKQLFVWQRIRIASKLSNSGPEWIYYFQKHNSGTYNNQWIILDYKLFEKGQPLKDNLLWIAEQVPGNVSSMDVTYILERGYWASYNVPAIPYIYEISGNKLYAEIRGVQESYDLAPRARIFRKYVNKYNNMTAVKNFMRYNNYKYDAVEHYDPTWAIMNRRDLVNESSITEEPLAFGGIDTKLADLEMLQNMSTFIKAGPTNQQQPTFTWNSHWGKTVYHQGLPFDYNFSWIQIFSKLTS